MSGRGRAGPASACKYFVSGACAKGAACPFRHDRTAPADNVCRYYLAGSCSYGQRCRYDHVRPKTTAPTKAAAPTQAPAHGRQGPSQATPQARPPAQPASALPRPPPHPGASTQAAGPSSEAPEPPRLVSLKPRKPPPPSSLRADAPVFVPSGAPQPLPSPPEVFSYAGAVSSGLPVDLTAAPAGPETPKDKICPYNITGTCYLGDEQCPFTHGLPCELCGKAVLHPTRLELNREHHVECVAFHEREMEAAFAAAESEGKTCGICMDVVRERAERGEQRFGILTNCKHCFCLRCIRQWRGQAAEDEELVPGQVDKRTVRRCPECRVSSEFVVPSAVWVEEPQAKAALIDAYRKRMHKIPCKYYASATTECPFGNRCHYRHERPDGTLDPGDDPAVVQRRIRTERERGGRALLADFLTLRALALEEFLEDELPGWLSDESDDFEDPDDPDFLAFQRTWLAGHQERQAAAQATAASTGQSGAQEAQTPGASQASGPPASEADLEARLIGQLQQDFADLHFFSVDGPAQPDGRTHGWPAQDPNPQPPTHPQPPNNPQ